jgi:hypothetical protein
MLLPEDAVRAVNSRLLWPHPVPDDPSSGRKMGNPVAHPVDFAADGHVSERNDCGDWQG